MKFLQSTMSPIKLCFIIFVSLIFGCENNQKITKEDQEQIKLEKETALRNDFIKFKDEIQSKHNTIFIDSLFHQDSSELAYSYQIGRKIDKIAKPLLTKAIILDINRLNDTTYMIKSIIHYNKKNSAGLLYAELKCSQQLINKIEDLGLNSVEMNYVFLLSRFDNYLAMNFETIDFTNYTSRRISGVCLDIEYNSKFLQFLEYDSYE